MYRNLVAKHARYRSLPEGGVYQLVRSYGEYFNVYTLPPGLDEDKLKQISVLVSLYEKVQPLNGTHYERARADQLQNAVLELITRITFDHNR